MNSFKKVLASTIALVLLSIPFTNVAMAASANKDYEGIESGGSLEKVLKEDDVTQEELDEYQEYVNKKLAEETQKPSPRWKVSTIKKGLEFIVQHKSVIPGKKLRGWVGKYGGKMVDALDNAKVTTKAGLVQAAVKVKVPQHVAEAIVDFLFAFLL